MLEIERQRVLAPVTREKVARLPGREGVERAGGVALQRLDLDHVRAAVGEELRAVRHRDELAELDDLDAGIGLGTGHGGPGCAADLSHLPDSKPSYIDGVPGFGPSPSMLTSPTVRPPVAAGPARDISTETAARTILWAPSQGRPEGTATEAENPIPSGDEATETSSTPLRRMLAASRRTNSPYRRAGTFSAARDRQAVPHLLRKTGS